MYSSGVVEKGRRVLVTGGTSGIGLGACVQLAREGHVVAVNGLPGDEEGRDAALAAVDAAGEEGGLGGGAAGYVPGMLGSPDVAGEVVACAEEVLGGGVEVLVNNAGIQHVAPVHEFPLDMWDKVIAVNLSAPFHLTRAVLPAMREAEFGRIVNVASAHGLVASPFKAAYVAAKHGLLGFSKSTALEVAELGITVNSVCPGYVLTPLVEAQIPDTAAARNISEDEVRAILLQAQPTRTFVTIQEVADAVSFLVRAPSITGTTISVDGGWTAQ